MVALSTAGQETTNGVSGSYIFSGQPIGATAAPPSSSSRSLARLTQLSQPNPAAEFHALLRRREATLSRDPATIPVPGVALAPAVPPTVGDQRTFSVCGNTTCSSFVPVAATAKHVGPRGAVYLDDDVPAGGFTQFDIDTVGLLFDNYMYAIDTTAFGRESDVDNNQVVIILLTDQVNQLSGNCGQTGSIIVGYFFGNDLIPGRPGSNGGEVFFSLVPDPVSGACPIARSRALALVAPVFIHEFQHMISFNQHVLVRGGASEEIWLNEGLSHYAEELGGRQIPGSALNVPDDTVRNRFIGGDLTNAFSYLQNLESSYLVFPGTSNGTLPERGAGWLFVRWLADKYGTDVMATNLTRPLVETPQRGGANVSARTGANFSTLVSEWQLANYLDDLSGFSDPSNRLDYDSWNFRQVAQANGLPYPLVPTSAVNGSYSRSGTLLAGSGAHVLVTQTGGGGEVRIELNTANTATLLPRIAVARIR